MMMMQRSSSAPQPAARRVHRRRASENPPSTDAIVPSSSPCAFTTLRRHLSCSSSWGGVLARSVSQGVASAGRESGWSPGPTSPPIVTTSSEAPFMPPSIASGTLVLSVDRVGVPPLASPPSQVEVPEVPRSRPPPALAPIPDGMPDTNSWITPPMEPQRSLAPPVETHQRPQPAAPAQGSVPAVPRAVPGTCMVCLEDCDDVVGPAWLHPSRPLSASPAAGGKDEKKDGDASVKINDCAISACLACLKTYFTGIVEAGFDGACPRMRCMCCPRVVCERAWAPLVEPSVLETFRKRATKLLSIQCGMCHNRGTIMVNPTAGHSYSTALDELVAAVDSAIDTESSESGVAPPAAVAAPAAPAALAAPATAGSSSTTSNPPAASISPTASASIDTEHDHVKNETPLPSCGQKAKLKEAFLVALDRYTSGEEIDVTPCYLALERMFSKPGLGAMTQEVRDDLVVLLMSCVEDSERRASLHIRFIRSNPMVVTLCCTALHCFRCRVIDGHPSQTCEQYEAQRGPEFVCKCPGCGVYVVKGDGCDSITCICGRNFCWSTLVNDRRMTVANAFRDAHPQDTGRAAMQIIRRSLGRAADAADADGQEVGGNDDAGGYTGEQQAAAVERVETAPLIREQQQDWGAEPTWEPEEPVQELVQELVEELVPDLGEQEELVLVRGEEEQLDRAPFQGTGQGPVTPREQEEEEEEELNRPLPGGGPMSAEDELRLANAYVVAYPREAAVARAAIFGEENPHFTAQTALAQVDQESRRGRVMSSLRYFGRPRGSSAAAVNEAEAEWQATAARDWVTQNRAGAELVRRTNERARSALVEAFYGDDTRLAHNTAIAHTAAEHARAALRVSPPLESNAASRSPPTGSGRRQHRGADDHTQEGEEEPLFRWLGIVEPPPQTLTVGGDAESSPVRGGEASVDEVGQEEETWEVPFAEAEIEEEVTEIVPAPSALWTPWPVGRGAPTLPPMRRRQGRPGVAGPATRRVSALAAFGTIRLQREVERWVAVSTSRQGRLRRVMAVEERELSKAWVALWGRQLRLDSSTRAWVDANDDETAAICTAARRVIFLEAHPEQICAEQRPMMKAFGRRNREAISKAREEATAELAIAWEQQHAASGAASATSAFNHAYAAYLRHVGTRASQALSAALAACSTSDPTGPVSAMTTRDLRRVDRMADAWAARNHRRICARRFADRFAHTTVAGRNAAEKGESAGHEAGGPTTMFEGTSSAAIVAVVALHVVPMLVGRSSQMCDCGIESVVSDAADWASLNAEAYDKEVDRVDQRLAATTMSEHFEEGGFVMGRAVEGCECVGEGSSLSSSSCRHLVACPVVTRRILKVLDPICSECEFANGFLDGALFDLFG